MSTTTIDSEKYVRITSGMLASGFGGAGAADDGGLPQPPTGFAYFIDSDSNYFVDSTGAFLLVKVA